MFRMNSIVRQFCTMCSAACLRNGPTYSIASPFAAYNHAKRFKSFSAGDTPKSSDSIDITDDSFDYESESPYSNVDFVALSEGDAEKLKALRVLELEIDLLRQQGEQVPSCLSAKRWKDLLTFDNASQRHKYLHHLWVVEMKHKHRREKSATKAQQYQEYRAQLTDPIAKTTASPLVYRLGETTIFHRLRDSTMNQFFNYQLLMAEWFGPKILVDCSYDQFMQLKNVQSCVKQMLIMWSDNRETTNPYDLIYCNVDPEGSLWQKFIERMPALNDADSPVHFTRRHYLEMFPREKLVYLTPHCSEVLHQYSHDDIYIIGK